MSIRNEIKIQKFNLIKKRLASVPTIPAVSAVFRGGGRDLGVTNKMRLCRHSYHCLQLNPYSQLAQMMRERGASESMIHSLEIQIRVD